jgi:GntR family transcriptional regulator
MTQRNNTTIKQSNKGDLLNALGGRIHLDFRADDPIFMQIVHQIEALVAEGTLKPGDQLPTVRELAIDLRINFSTVARAYRILDEQRLISTQRGRGTYIEEPTVPGRTQMKDNKASYSSTEKLAGLAQRYIREAAHAGASVEQIEQAFREQLEGWQREHPADSRNRSGGT